MDLRRNRGGNAAPKWECPRVEDRQTGEPPFAKTQFRNSASGGRIRHPDDPQEPLGHKDVRTTILEIGRAGYFHYGKDAETDYKLDALTEAGALALQLSHQTENLLMKKAVEARPLSGYRIWLRYADGVEGEVDLSRLAGRGVFKAWNDRTVFEGVHVDGSGAVTWNEDIDLCPDALYLRLTGKTVGELFPKLKTPVDA